MSSAVPLDSLVTPESLPNNSSPGKPVSSITFKDLLHQDSLLNALDRLGMKTPTPVQEQTIPRAIAGRDLIVQAKTGSGKTFAFSLPLLSHLESIKGDLKKRTTFGLIVSPTRELATQISKVITSLSPEFKPACLIGGDSIRNQIRALEEDSRIVVGTPGRLLDLYEQRKFSLDKCQYLVLDEADEMLSMGFIDDIRKILSKLPKEKQGLFVSATISPYIESLANSFLKNPERVTVSTPTEELPSIDHCYIDVGMGVAAKTSGLCHAIEKFSPRSAIVFCNTKSDTELVEVILKRRGFQAEKINSDLPQKQRDNIIQRVKAGELKILVGTDIAARGLDIDFVDLVVNYAIHDQAELYVHRTGRTGRAGRSGTAISLVGPQDFSAFFNLKKAMPNIEFKKIVVE